jgi:hypothetical protein
VCGEALIMETSFENIIDSGPKKFPLRVADNAE